MDKKLAGIKQEIERARQAKNNGGFPASEMKKYPTLTERKKLKGHFGKVYSLHFCGAADPEKIVSASQDGKLIVWNALTTHKHQAIPLRSSWVMTCAFEQKTGNFVACGGLDNLCSIYDIKTSEIGTITRSSKELAGHDGYLSCCRFLNGTDMVTSSGDSTCMHWDIESQKNKKTFRDHTHDVMFLALSPEDPNIFVSGACDATACVWDLRTANRVMQYEGHDSDINSVAFFPDGMAFGTGSDDSSCRIFDMRAYQQLNQFTSEKVICGVTSVSFSKSGRFLFGGYDDYQAIAWDSISEGRDFLQNMSHENRVSCLGVHEKGHALATGSWDTLIKVWA